MEDAQDWVEQNKIVVLVVAGAFITGSGGLFCYCFCCKRSRNEIHDSATLGVMHGAKIHQISRESVSYGPTRLSFIPQRKELARGASNDVSMLTTTYAWSGPEESASRPSMGGSDLVAAEKARQNPGRSQQNVKLGMKQTKAWE